MRHVVAIAVALLVLVAATPAWAGFTQRVNLSNAGEQAEGGDGAIDASISADGRFVAFESNATNLVPGDTNGQADVFVRDRQTGTTTRVSVSSSGEPGNGRSFEPAISPDGRFVAFASSSVNLVPDDTNGLADVFVHDRQSGTTERVNLRSDGTQIGFPCGEPSISADGQMVAFEFSRRRGDLSTITNVLVRDRATGKTIAVRVKPDGSDTGGGETFGPAMSADGRFVAFSSFAPTLVEDDTNQQVDVFVRDLQLGRTTRDSVSAAGEQGNGPSLVESISADGRFVAFSSNATNLVSPDPNKATDAFVRDRQTGTVNRISVQTGGAEENAVPSRGGPISANGRYVAFSSSVGNLVAGDTNRAQDVFLRDRARSETTRMSVASDGTHTPSGSNSTVEAISANGRFVAFTSTATNLVGGDTNGVGDLFVHDRLAGAPARAGYDATAGLSIADGPAANTSLGVSIGDGAYTVTPLGGTTPPTADAGCAQTPDTRAVRCAIAGSDVIGVSLGDGSDRFGPAAGGCSSGIGQVSATGGPGNDTLVGGPRPDALRGDAGIDSLQGCGSGDVLDGGDGSDTLTTGTGDGADVIVGGTGGDRVVYQGSAAVNVSIDDPKGTADDGLPGEGDEVRSDVEHITAGSGADVVIGNTLPNNLRGSAGNDRITGGSEPDDGFSFSPCELSGAGCADTIDGGLGVDALFGEGGDDLLSTRDGTADATIDCGPGTDTAFVDLLDSPERTCENIDQGAVGEGPHVRLDVRRPLRLRGGRLAVPLRCPRKLVHACRGTLAVARTQGGIARRPRRPYRIQAGGSRRIRVPVPRSARRARRVYVQSVEPGDIKGEKTTRRLARIA